MSKIGNIISKHRSNSSLALVSILMGGLFVGVSILLALVINKANPEGRSLIFNTMVGSAALGVGLLICGLKLRQGKVFLLAQHGVAASGSGTTREFPFADITETVQMFRHGVSVGIAFRSEKHPEWETVNGHLSGFAKFRNELIEGYLQEKVPASLARLANNLTLNFKITTLKGKIQEAMSMGIHQYLKVATENVELSRAGIVLQNRQILWSQIASTNRNEWFEKITLKLTDGTEVSISTTSLFEPDLFLAMVNQLVNDHAIAD